jgi:methionyl aminopeptidase
VTAVEILSPRVLERVREACRLAAETLVMVGRNIRPGMATEDINRLVHDYTVRHGAWPSPLNYHGFPKSVCTSVNEVVCHGIPGPRVLAPGDIVNVDVTSRYPAEDGCHGDTSATFYVGEPPEQTRHLVEVARQCLEAGIEQVRDGARIGDIGAAIQELAESCGCSVVRDYVGHGTGPEFHTAPQVPHFGKRGTGRRLKQGMVFTIEPMINAGVYECEVLEDGWTVVTRDRSLSAQFEHTVLVTRDGCEVLTRRDELLRSSEDVPWAKLGPRSCPAAFSGS